ncbi:NADH:ubiquinone oxidoreductase subunit NDUFA12 [Salipiger pallidus]|uniref:NADH:ubiquinone oxidoreductase subunit NDUFA12 n=1 Tax=Salipiger pallidus TaxID=1775170 RepID=A0A8J2ZPC2_9RHOB|nr:NADH:ubiquinone oxidoreductase subunit NDUFA12 [Salipiger pallidus]GGG87236.1 NADH:ubiquinone oxidoreductase subunit NDUFA12 [Salipiger pallidus]
MGILNSLLKAVTWWNGGTLNTMIWSKRHGTRVGEDEQGNTFYQTKDGARRWVMYNGEVEATRISPDWHGWLHHTFKEAPTERPMVHKTWEKPHIENLTGTALAYAPQGSIRQPQPAARADYEAWSPE